MILKQTTDTDEIKSVLCHEGIYDCISSDYCSSAEDFEPPISDEYRYIAGFVDNEIIGLMVYHNQGDFEMCHIQVLPEHRKQHAIKYAEQALSFKSTLPLYAQIPSYYKNVVNFAKANDFKVIGLDDEIYLKNGVEYPIINLRYEG